MINLELCLLNDFIARNWNTLSDKRREVLINKVEYLHYLEIRNDELYV